MCSFVKVNYETKEMFRLKGEKLSRKSNKGTVLVFNEQKVETFGFLFSQNIFLKLCYT